MQPSRVSFNRRLLPLLWYLCLISAGCSWFSDELTVSVNLPDPPEHWIGAFPQLSYELVIPRVDGTSERLPWPAEAKLSIPKEPNWPVLAVPLALEGRVELPSAGGVWPLDLSADGQELVLSWESGPLATVLMALRRECIDVSSLNTTRLTREMQERSGGDPWRLDLVHLEKRLASGEFRVTDIRPLPCRDVLLSVPAGQWFLESPFFAPLISYIESPLILPDVPLGFHQLFAMGRSAWDDLLVTELEALVIPGNQSRMSKGTETALSSHRTALFFAVSSHQSGNEVLRKNDKDQ
jgi:hypothetical protein